MSTATALLVAVALLVGNAFFVAAEFALISARRSQIEPLAQGGSRMARSTLRAMEQVTMMLAGVQLGVTVCSVGLGAVAEPAISHLLEGLFEAVSLPEALTHPVSFTIALALVGFLHVVLGEMVPKNIALAGPDRAALVLGPIMLGLVVVLRPIIVGLNAVASAVLRLLGVESKDEVSATFTREEVAALVEESRTEGELEEDEYDRLAGALGFTEKTVAAVELPQRSLTVIARGSTVADVEAVCASTGYSRFPVSDGAGGLLGYLHIKDALEPDESKRGRVIDEKWIRPFATVAADQPLHEVLETLQRRGAHMARVVDGAGATHGLATLEDVIEELVGEIRDAAHLEGAVTTPDAGGGESLG